MLPEGADAAALNVKYQLNYGRLAEALALDLAYEALRDITQDLDFEKLDEDAEAIEGDLYLDNAVAGNRLEDLAREIDAAVWFVALLTRVDGLVLFDSQLCVKGFGVVIGVEDEPPAVYEATTALGGRTKKLDYQGFGTRHRSMMRACWAIRGSVGFVVSQDGMVRAMIGSDKGVVVWPDLMTQRLRTNLPVPPAARLEQLQSEAEKGGGHGA